MSGSPSEGPAGSNSAVGRAGGRGLVQEAIRQVPATRYVLVIGAIGVVGGIVAQALGIQLKGYQAAYAIPVGLLLMFVVVMFARQVDGGSGRTGPVEQLPGQKGAFWFITWAASILLVAFGVLVLTAAVQQIIIPSTPPTPRAPAKVEGQGPVFSPPRFGGRTIDACINSPLFPEPSGYQCVRSAQHEIADAFCKAAHYAYVDDDFSTVFSQDMHSSYKYEQVPGGSDGSLRGQWIPYNTGGATFSSITCVK